MSNTTMLKAALAYAALGFHVLACKTRSKKPLTKRGLLDATTNAGGITQRWTETPGANIGLACEASGLVAIDVDPRHHGNETTAALIAELGPLPETVEAATGGLDCGRHLIFVAPAGAEFWGGLGPGVDIRHRAYILVEPSIHPDTGRPYHWLRSPLDQMPAPLPGAWLAKMVKPTVPKAATPTTATRTTNECTPYGRAAKHDEIEKVRTTPKGARNTELFKSAAALGELYAGSAIDDCRTELVAAVVAPDFTEHEARRTVESGWRAGLKNPRIAPQKEGKPMPSLAGKTAIAAKTSTASSEDENWPSPLSLVASVEREPYPVDALPPTVRGAVTEVQTFAQAPVAMVAMSALGAISLAVQALADVERAEGLAGPVGLYSLALAPSGERKSSIDGYFTEPIRKYELAEAEKGEPLERAFKADFAAWEAKKRGLESKIERASKEGKDSKEEEERLRVVALAEPKPPMVPRFLYTDATMEGLAFGLAKGWPSGGILSSEAGSVFGAHSMTKETIMRTLALYNTCWDGGSIRIDRRAAGASYWVRNARLTMSLQVQPDVLLDFLKSDRGLSRGSGFLARMLTAYPESTQGSRRYREPPKAWPALERFHKRTTEILNMPVNIDEHGGLTPVVLPLASEAHGAWIKFHDRIESELKIGGALCDVRDVASKIADNACRIAAIFQVFEYGLGAVGLSAFDAGARIAEWHLTEARRFFGEVAMPEENAKAELLDSWLLAYCRGRGVSSVPVSTIQKAGPSKLRGKVELDSTIAALAELGRARLANPQGKAKVVEINPALLAAAVIAVNAVVAQPTRKAVI